MQQNMWSVDDPSLPDSLLYSGGGSAWNDTIRNVGVQLSPTEAL